MAIDNRNMDILEIKTKTALVRSRIPGVEYVINPYVGLHRPDASHELGASYRTDSLTVSHERHTHTLQGVITPQHIH